MVKLHKADDGPRLYEGAGFAVPSVTECLKLLERRHLESWRHRVGRKEADRVRSDAKAFGTRIHAVAQSLAWNRGAEAEGDLEPFAEAIRLFLARHVREVLATELSLVSPKERVGGTLDLYCRLRDDSYALVDYKTSAQLDRVMGLQTALYALLLREHGYEVNRRLVVRIKKDAPGKFYVRAYEDHAGDVRAARAAVELWWWQHGAKVRRKEGA